MKLVVIALVISNLAIWWRRFDDWRDTKNPHRLKRR